MSPDIGVPKTYTVDLKAVGEISTSYPRRTFLSDKRFLLHTGPPDG